MFLPFAAGYYLSYLFRMINTLICGRLASELELGTADLGLLGSIYFLVVTGSQIPMGMLLDRFGPRRVQGALLLLAPQALRFSDYRVDFFRFWLLAR